MRTHYGTPITPIEERMRGLTRMIANRKPTHRGTPRQVTK